MANGWGTIHPVLENNPTSPVLRGEATNLRRTNLGNEPRHHFSTLQLARADRISPPARLTHFLLATQDMDLGL
jgi:hypothetical protein